MSHEIWHPFLAAPRTAHVELFPSLATLYQGVFQRNSLALGVAFFQHGFLDQAQQTFKQVIAAKPDDPEAYYNLGTLNLRRNSLLEAQQYLEQTVKLRPNYPEAWNNLGMLAAQKGNARPSNSKFPKVPGIAALLRDSASESRERLSQTRQI